MFSIVPTFVSDAINVKLDEAFKDCPEASKDRDVLFNKLLVYFDEHGEIPEFKLARKSGVE